MILGDIGDLSYNLVLDVDSMEESDVYKFNGTFLVLDLAPMSSSWFVSKILKPPLKPSPSTPRIDFTPTIPSLSTPSHKSASLYLSTPS